MSVEERVLALEQAVLSLSSDIGELKGATNTISTLVKFVVLPLIIIVGGLVGIKIV